MFSIFFKLRNASEWKYLKNLAFDDTTFNLNIDQVKYTNIYYREEEEESSLRQT